MRIVSLVPSATEIVCSLGLIDALAGVSADCDFPPEVRRKPVLTEAVVTPEFTSAAIDRRIRSQVHAGKSAYHFDAAALARLRPNVILSQELCAVCAPSSTVVRQAARMVDGVPRIISLEPRGLLDILENIVLVGDLTGTAEQAAAVVRRLRDRIDAVVARARGPRPRVVCLEWLDPLYVGGHWIPEMVAAAGGLDVLGTLREPSSQVEWDEVTSVRPDVLVLMPCGLDIARTRKELGLLSAHPGWQDLPAVRAGRVYLTDASSYFNRPGPRIVDGLEILAGIIHPDIAIDVPPGSVERL